MAGRIKGQEIAIAEVHQGNLRSFVFKGAGRIHNGSFRGQSFCAMAAIVQASPEDIRSFARLDFYRQVLHALRGHVGIRDRIENLPLARMPRKKSTDPAEWLEVRDAVISALEIARVKVIGVDEAQHLMHSDAAQRPGV